MAAEGQQLMWVISGQHKRTGKNCSPVILGVSSNTRTRSKPQVRNQTDNGGYAT
jgi:hypothetical protein